MPIVCGALAVGVLVWAVYRRWGPTAGATAGLVLASNPMYVQLSRSARGYSMLVLVAIVSTSLLLHLLRACDRAAVVGYILVVAAGVMTHLFMSVVLLTHVAEVARRRRVDAWWWLIWSSIAALALFAYARMTEDLLRAGQDRGRIFKLTFPPTSSGRR